jgi:hypothetical protein
VTHIVTEIAAASLEQSTSIDESNKALERIGTVTQSKAILLAGAFVLATAWSAAAQAFGVTIHSIVSDPAKFDHSDVVLLGRVASVRATTPRAGSAYTTFRLDDASGNGITVFMWGRPDLADGEQVRVIGEFKTAHRVGGHTLYDEVDASSVVPWQ